MQYWIIIDNRKTGPMSLEELRRIPLQRDSLVWHSGLPSWRQARFIDELADILPPDGITTAKANPYIMSATSEQTVTTGPVAVEPKPPTYLAWCIVAICICSTIPAIVALIYALKVSSAYACRNYSGARKASEMAGLWLATSITLGVIAIPFFFVSMAM